MRLNFDVVAMLRTQAKHNYIHSIPILTPHSDNAPNEEKAIPPKNPTIMHRKIIVFTSIDREKPCKGDTSSKPRAQALGQSLKHIY